MIIQTIKFKAFYVLVVLLPFTFCLLSTDPAYAEATGLSISPPTTVIEAKPPTIIYSTITIRNDGNDPASLQPRLKLFKPSESGHGEVQFLLPTEIASDEAKLISGIEIRENGQKTQQIKLAPNQEKKLEVAIPVLEATSHRDYYFTVVFLSDTKESFSNNATISKLGIGTNILLSVGQREKPYVIIDEFSTPALLNKGPVPFSIKLRNPGNQLVTPSGSMSIKNIFGQKVGEIEILPQNVLAKSSRTLTSKESLKSGQHNFVWNESFLLGVYSATLRVDTGDGVVQRDIKFFAFPYHIALLILFAILLILFVKKRINAKI